MKLYKKLTEGFGGVTYMSEERRVAIVIRPLQRANTLQSVAFGVNQTK
jgi:hypothetical protein